ncbi:MAG: hypothetical protein MUF64_01460, partial [Polyangiaceae bacterium]|nr:hypothetical protein [Polyangiaceae bacterium]
MRTSLAFLLLCGAFSWIGGCTGESLDSTSPTPGGSAGSPQDPGGGAAQGGAQPSAGAGTGGQVTAGQASAGIAGSEAGGAPGGGAPGGGAPGGGAPGGGAPGGGAPGGGGQPGAGNAGSGGTSGEPVAYPEGILCPTGNSDPRCGPGFDPAAPMDPATLATALAEGQATWYAPGKGGGCVNCHSPDGIEFAWVGYSDCDLRRRSLTHVTEEQAEKLIGYAHALRQVHQIERPLHPDHYRPFQPAFEPLGEVETDLDVVDTKKQDQRDELFMNQLTQEKKLLFVNGTIDSLEKAHQAYNELLGMDLEG